MDENTETTEVNEIIEADHESNTEQIASENVEVQNNGEVELTPEEYQKKAEELEARLDRLEGRGTKEQRLAAIFTEQKLSVNVHPIEPKGMGMVATEPIAQNTVVMSCPPYACVPYEPRKRFVCSYCFKGFKKLEDQWNAAQQQSTDIADSLNNLNLNDVQEIANLNEDVEQLTDIDKPSSLPESPFTEINDKMTQSEHIPQDLNLNQSTIDISQDEIALINPEEFEFDNVENEKNNVDDEITELICCPYCQELWYCCQECLELDSHEHLEYECVSLQNFDINWAKDYYQYCDDLITDVRLLIKVMNRRMIQLENQSNEFYDEYCLLISNKDCYTEEVLETLRGVVQYANYLVPDHVFMDEEELLDVYCKHRVNMFGLWNEGGDCLGYGVYPRASYFNHSCWPNTTFYKNTTSKAPYMDFMTVWDIEEAGEEVCISYIDISAGLMPRRQTLLEKYFFHCTCQRCVYQEENPQEEDPYNIYWVQQPSTETQPEDTNDEEYIPPNEPSDIESQEDNKESCEPNGEVKHKKESLNNQQELVSIEM